MKSRSLLLFLFGIFCIASFVSCIQESYTYDSKGKRDPFIPLVTPEGNIVEIEPEEQIPGINLEGIIYDPRGESYAIINRMVVEAGDVIGDYKLFEIKSDRIVLLKDNQMIEVELRKEEEE